jgi:hypothetical protein
VPIFSNLGKDYGNPELLTSARYSSGLLFVIGVGQRTDLLKESCLTLIDALYVIRKKKQFSTC